MDFLTDRMRLGHRAGLAVLAACRPCRPIAAYDYRANAQSRATLADARRQSFSPLKKGGPGGVATTVASSTATSAGFPMSGAARHATLNRVHYA